MFRSSCSVYGRSALLEDLSDRFSGRHEAEQVSFMGLSCECVLLCRPARQVVVQDSVRATVHHEELQAKHREMLPGACEGCRLMRRASENTL